MTLEFNRRQALKRKREEVDPDDVLSPDVCNTLLNLSGGVDSVYCLWHYLKKGIPLVIHHVYLVHRDHHLVCNEGKANYEQKAVEGVLRWAADNYDTPFTYVETMFDYGPQIPAGITDVEVVAFMSSVIMRNTSYGIQNLVISANAEDNTVGQTCPRHTRRMDMLRILVPRPINLLWPIKNKTKVQLLEEMPPDLVDLCWFCHRPDEEGKRCRRCEPCRKMNEHERNKSIKEGELADSARPTA